MVRVSETGDPGRIGADEVALDNVAVAVDVDTAGAVAGDDVATPGPPTVLLAEVALMRIPASPLGRADVPVGSRPM